MQLAERRVSRGSRRDWSQAVVPHRDFSAPFGAPTRLRGEARRRSFGTSKPRETRRSDCMVPAKTSHSLAPNSFADCFLKFSGVPRRISPLRRSAAVCGAPSKYLPTSAWRCCCGWSATQPRSGRAVAECARPHSSVRNVIAGNPALLNRFPIGFHAQP